MAEIDHVILVAAPRACRHPGTGAQPHRQGAPQGGQPDEVVAAGAAFRRVLKGQVTDILRST